MAEKKQESFTVTDRRLFTSDGELRQEVSEEEVSTSKPASPVAAEARPSATEPSPLDTSSLDSSAPPNPSAAEQKEQADAYRKSASELDARVELSGHSAKEMEMTFERFMRCDLGTLRIALKRLKIDADGERAHHGLPPFLIHQQMRMTALDRDFRQHAFETAHEV